ncbi:MAG: DUF547 domain-containing protein [Nitrospinales bacterium]
MNTNLNTESMGLKRYKKNRSIPMFLLWLSGALLFLVSGAEAVDFSVWDSLSKKYVSSKTIDGIPLTAVAYKDLKKDAQLTQVLVKLEKVDLGKLKTREEKLSFWINVYNIMAVKMVLDNYPVESIKDAGSLFKSVWKKPVGVVGGKQRTLNEIEHEILRKMGEPRIHVAIVCASVSCPDLRRGAFTPEDLEAQLDEQMKSFLKNQQKGMRIDSKKGRLYLSSIFDWFEEDFDS